MNDISPKQQNDPPVVLRPTVVTVVAVFGFIASLLWVPLPRAWQHGYWYASHMLLSSTLGMVCMYGFWKTWRWSVFLYAALAVLDILHYCLLLRHRVYGPPVVEFVIALVGIMYVRRMR